MYCISKEITGIDKDLVFDKEKNLLKRQRIETDLLIGKETDINSISYFSKNAQIPLELEIPIKYKNMWGFIKRNPDWSDVLGVEKFVKLCKQLLSKTNAFIENDNNKYYYETAKNHYDLFKEIQAAKISEQKLLDYIQSINPYKAKKLLSQIQENRKYFKKVEYSLFNTTTGRMTVTSGLNLLTLKKKIEALKKLLKICFFIKIQISYLQE